MTTARAARMSLGLPAVQRVDQFLHRGPPRACSRAAGPRPDRRGVGRRAARRPAPTSPCRAGRAAGGVAARSRSAGRAALPVRSAAAADPDPRAAAAALGGRSGDRTRSGEQLAQPLEAGHGPGRQEVVDVRIGRLHPGGERLVAAVPASGLSQTRRWQLRWSRAISRATSAGSPRSQPSETTMTTALRAQHPARPLLVELAEADSPIRVPPAQSVTASATLASAAVPIAVAQEPGDPGQARPEHERLGRGPRTSPPAPGRSAGAAATGAPSSR